MGFGGQVPGGMGSPRQGPPPQEPQQNELDPFGAL